MSFVYVRASILTVYSALTFGNSVDGLAPCKMLESISNRMAERFSIYKLDERPTGGDTTDVVGFVSHMCDCNASFMQISQWKIISNIFHTTFEIFNEIECIVFNNRITMVL